MLTYIDRGTTYPIIIALDYQQLLIFVGSLVYTDFAIELD